MSKTEAPNLAAKRTAATDGVTLPDSPPKPRRGKKQLDIPGTERPDAIPDLEEKALELAAMKEQIAGLRESVKDLKGELDVMLVEHKLEIYKFIGDGRPRVVKASTRRTVDVSTEKNKTDDGGEE